MIVKKVRYKNFFSAKDIEVNFEDYQGITLIQGENGAGKSILFEAVVYGITGRSIRKSNEESMVNNQASKNCEVEIWVDDAYIKRTRKPTSLEFKVGDETRTREDAKHTQEEIEKYLGTNYKVLMASTVFGQHSDVDFLGATLDDKRTIIRTFLNLEEVFKTRDNIKTKKSFYQTRKKTLQAALDENLDQQVRLENKIEKLSVDLPDVPDISLEEILNREKQAEEIGCEITDLENAIHTCEKEISILQKDIDKGPGEGITACHACGQPVREITTREDIYKAKCEISVLEKEISKHEREIRNLTTDLSSIDIPISSQEYSKLEQAIADKKLIDSHKEQLGKLKEREEVIREDQLKSVSSYEVMRFWETAFSEKGLLQYVIKNILDYFNSRCNYYLYHVANGKYWIEFDEHLTESIWTEKRQLIFHSLSGGQKRMINLSVMLALQDLLCLTGSNRTDLLFFDEIGENLSEASLYGLYILLNELKKNGKKIFLITHNEALKSLLDFTSSIKVNMKDGITYLDGNQGT